MATVEVLLPNLCNVVDKKIGTSNPIKLIEIHNRVESIKGFFDNLDTSVLILGLFSPPSL